MGENPLVMSQAYLLSRQVLKGVCASVRIPFHAKHTGHFPRSDSAYDIIESPGSLQPGCIVTTSLRNGRARLDLLSTLLCAGREGLRGEILIVASVNVCRYRWAGFDLLRIGR